MDRLTKTSAAVTKTASPFGVCWVAKSLELFFLSSTGVNPPVHRFRATLAVYVHVERFTRRDFGLKKTPVKW